MADPTPHLDFWNHRVLNDDQCEVAHFACKFGLTMPEARELIEKYRGNREALEREARALAASGLPQSPPAQ